MGEDTVSYFTQVSGNALPPSQSARLRMHGYIDLLPTGHWGIYGADAEKIKALASQNPRWQLRIHPLFPNLLAEVVWACQHEMALHLEDVLSRRIRMLVLDAQAAIDAAAMVAHTMAEVLGKDKAWIATELQAFQKIAQQYLIDKK